MTEYDVGVVGLGYVGLTLATVLAEVNFSVLGIERRSDVVDALQSGQPHFAENGLDQALRRVTTSGKLVAEESFPEDTRCGIYIITVGTPLDASGNVQLAMIQDAAEKVARNMGDDALVILRSTVKVGTTRNIVAPILEASGKRFKIAFCPERTLEGKALLELRELPQIVGADTQAARDHAASLFGRVTKSIVQVENPETAEVIKLVDNTYRDVQFAFANEVARFCDGIGVNAHEVIASGKLGYARTNVPLPGLVGGPCLEKDPHILVESARSCGIDLEITAACRLVNERQPYETAAFIDQEMKRRGAAPDADIAILGMAFKGVPETDDLRGSMSLKVLDAIEKLRPDAAIRVYDAMVSRADLTSLLPEVQVCDTLADAVTDATVIVIANNHPALGRVPPLDLYQMMQSNGFIYDYWNHFSNLSQAELGGSYFAVGNAHVAP